jgi:arylsulfatase A
MLKLAATGSLVGLGGIGLNSLLSDKNDMEINRMKQPVLTKNPDGNNQSPNILVIMADDLGFGDLGCYGSKAIHTPNIDKLASTGMKFTDFYSSNAVCSPARYGLLTGRYPNRGGLQFPLWAENQPLGRKLARSAGQFLGNLGLTDVGEDSISDGISPGELTIAEALRQVGYRTGLMGKWHLGDFAHLPKYHPHKHGFDEFYGTPCGNAIKPFLLYRGEEKIEDDVPDDEQSKMTRRISDEAIEFIEKSDENPYFLLLSYTAPHRPLFASDEFRYKSKGGLYGDVVEEIDFYVGKVLDAVEKSGKGDDTLILFTSDNGAWYYGSNGGLRGGKGQSFEGGFRVPLIANWPGHIQAGSICQEPAINLDIFPTLLSLVGLDLPTDRIIDGKNVLGLLTGSEAESPHDALYFYHSDILEGIRVGKYKYYRKINLYKYPVPVNKKLAGIAAGKLGKWPLLYDLETDPYENYDLSDNQPELVAEMEAIMSLWEKQMAENPEGIMNRS